MAVKSKSRRATLSITQLDFARRALDARLAHLRDGCECEATIAQIENLDLQLAAAPAKSLGELRVKYDRLLDILMVCAEDMSSPEAVFVNSIRRDLNNLSFDDQAIEDKP